MNRFPAFLLCACAAAACAAPAPRPIEGTVTRVFDGDTVLLADAAGDARTVRLSGIDAPEICQPHGPEARQALEELVLGKPVTALPKGLDGTGRTLARLVRDGADVGDRLVRDGHAWSYRYKYDRGPYVAQERMAHALYRGLHADRQAIMPREFRKRHGRCTAP